MILDSIANDAAVGITTIGSAGTPTFDLTYGNGSGLFEVSMTGAGASAFGFYSAAAPASFTNSGIFGAFSDSGAATGATLAAGGGFNNISEFVTSSGGVGSAVGLIAAGATAIQNSGSFIVRSATADAYGLELTSFGGCTLTNSGSVNVSTNGGGRAYGISLGDPSGGAATIVNTGSINANVAIQVSGPLNLNLTNSGGIQGAITLGAGSGNTIANTGHIIGVITLSATGIDTYDGRNGGTESGGIHLGGGADTVYLGDDGENAYGGAGNAIVVGGAGADYITAGTGPNTLTGGGGADTFVFGTPSGSATITDFSHAAGDKIDLSAFGFSSLSGVMADAAQVGSDTVITVGGLVITLDNVTAANLQASDFRFGPVTITSTETVTIDASVNISAASGYLALFGGYPSGTLINHGSLSSTVSSGTTTGVSTSYEPDPSALFVNSGTLSVTGPGAIGIDYATTHNTGTITVTGTSTVTTQGATGDVVNSGTMTVQGVGLTYGVYDWNPGRPNGVFQNLATGTVSVSSSAGAATGVGLVYSYDFENAGNITVSAATSATGVSYSPYVGANIIINTGTITVSGATSTGISVSSSYGVSPVGLQNSGTITAQTAIKYFTGASIANSGTLHGAVQLSASDDTVTNTGTIDGAVNLGSGNDTLDSHLGTISGTITLGAGSSTATLGAENNTVALAAGIHVVDGGGGVNTVSYAKAASGVQVSLALQGQAQNTGVGTDTLSHFQGLIGSAFTDHLTGDSSDNLINGRGGDDVLTGGGGHDTFIIDAGAGHDVITDFDTAHDLINLSAYFSDYAAVQAAASQQGANTVIQLGSSGLLTLDNVSMNALAAGEFGFTAIAPPGGGTVTGTVTNHYTVSFEGAYRQYTVGTGGTTVGAGPEGGTDVLANIQRVQFVDGYLATGTTDTAGQVYRLYEATLNRAPDAVGLANWVHSLNGGTGLQTVVNGFVGSSEFQQNYGNLDDAAFVTLLYRNVLHRDPDTAGLTNWVNLLASGHSRAEVVTGFSESPEDIAALAGPVQQGLWIQDAAAAEAARLYDTVLGRLPDASGLASWTHQLESGTSLQAVANGFVGSAEFQANYGALNNSAFVTLLYHNVLHRDPDPAGLDNWVNSLNSGQSRAQVVLGFSESPEHIDNTAAHVDYGVWLG